MNIRPYKDHLPTIATSAYVDESACIIGDVSLGNNASVWPMAVIRGDVNKITIGNRTNVQDGAILHVTCESKFVPGGKPLTIGDNVTIGHGAVLHACSIADLCLIGMNATVLDGAIVKSKTMIAAGSVVAPGKILEGGYLYIGSPAKQARPLTENELAYLEFSAQHYVELKDDYLFG
ncbi:MAG: gamma carbonic anhydrase family protein [Gammaproteobacteria bacterium]|nr:gamma carbonic anhydrase family protein [Gammaproteobacteria bacterium]PCH62048.1 MAG: gamma carbonic anhydrase family protein [Gammaproteobacteria bacterium]